MTDILLVMIWAQPVSIGFQQTTKVAASKESQSCMALNLNLNNFILQPGEYVNGSNGMEN